MEKIQGFNGLKEHYSKEEIAKSYEKLRFSNLAGKIEHETTINFLNSIISKKQPKFLLEIATGPGRMTKYVKLPHKGIGIDTSESMLRLAKESVSNKNWKFTKADVNKMPFKQNFDMVITFRLLIHFTDKQRQEAYKKIRNVLKNKRILIFDMGNKDYKKPFLTNSLLNFYRIFKKENKNKLLPEIYNNPVNIKDLVNELKINQFSIIKIYGVNYYSNLVLLLLSLSKRLKFLSSFIKSFIIKIEKNNQNKLKKYATFIVVAQK